MISKGKSQWAEDHVPVAESVSLQNQCSKNNCTKPSPALIAGFCAPSSACFVSDEINLLTKLFFAFCSSVQNTVLSSSLDSQVLFSLPGIGLPACLISSHLQKEEQMKSDTKQFNV